MLLFWHKWKMKTVSLNSEKSFHVMIRAQNQTQFSSTFGKTFPINLCYSKIVDYLSGHNWFNNNFTLYIHFELIHSSSASGFYFIASQAFLNYIDGLVFFRGSSSHHRLWAEQILCIPSIKHINNCICFWQFQIIHSQILRKILSTKLKVHMETKAEFVKIVFFSNKERYQLHLSLSKKGITASTCANELKCKICFGLTTTKAISSVHQPHQCVYFN